MPLTRYRCNWIGFFSPIPANFLGNCIDTSLKRGVSRWGKPLPFWLSRKEHGFPQTPFPQQKKKTFTAADLRLLSAAPVLFQIRSRQIYDHDLLFILLNILRELSMSVINLADFMSSVEAAVYLGITSTRVAALRRTGRLIGMRVGSSWLYSKSELDRYKTTRKTGRPKGYSPKRKRKEEHEKNLPEE